MKKKREKEKKIIKRDSWKKQKETEREKSKKKKRKKIHENKLKRVVVNDHRPKRV